MKINEMKDVHGDTPETALEGTGRGGGGKTSQNEQCLRPKIG